ncbi:unnamed protein product [Dicrocoelium dendriticum]|nr:unnamed protein product [Dicrocoelium dendriticum]
MIISMRRVARRSVQSIRRCQVSSSTTPSSERAPYIPQHRSYPPTLLFLDHARGIRCEYFRHSPHWQFCNVNVCSLSNELVISNHNIGILSSTESSRVVHKQNKSDLIQIEIFSALPDDSSKTGPDRVHPDSYSSTASSSPSEDPKKPSQKLTLWQKAKKEIVHYYHGFRLLGLEIKIASGICLRLLWGHSLTRRERKQLVRTVADIIRLVPFLVFVIVPFMEFLLPFYLKFFPFMLPSTFKEKTSETDKIRQRLKAKLEMTRFLQETLQQTSGTTSVAERSPTISQFQEFLETVQKSGQPASTEDITRFSKLFEDQITLDSLEVKQLKMLCQLLSLPTMGPSNLLRFQIWMRVRQLKAEDQLIAKEGVDELPVWELQSLCQERGMRSAGLTVERLRSQLSQWLTLHLEKNVPVTLLLFSRALHVSKASLDEFLVKEIMNTLLNTFQYRNISGRFSDYGFRSARFDILKLLHNCHPRPPKR